MKRRLEKFFMKFKKKKGKGKWLDLIYIYTISICVFRSRSVSIIKAAPLFSVEFSLLSWVNLTHKITQTGFIHTYIHAPTHPRTHASTVAGREKKFFHLNFVARFFHFNFLSRFCFSTLIYSSLSLFLLNYTNTELSLNRINHTYYSFPFFKSTVLFQSRSAQAFRYCIYYTKLENLVMTTFCLRSLNLGSSTV